MTISAPFRRYTGEAPALHCRTAGQFIVGLLLLSLFLSPRQAFSQANRLNVKPFAQPSNALTTSIDIRSTTAADVLHLTVGRSVILNSATSLHRVYVGNPAVLQTFTSGSDEIVLTAKTPGVSSMVLWDDAGNKRLYTVSADVDPDALRTSLAEAFPNSAIHADTAEGKIFLKGSVGSAADSEAATKMATLYAKEVVNSLQVVANHEKQVQLKLRIVEVDRTKLDESGINIFAGGRTQVATSTQQYSSSSGAGSGLTISDPLNLFLYSNKLNLGVTIKDLEQKQILQVLAEPTLTTMSGLKASFLSGGEFPFPVVQGGVGTSTAISIQFRPYGVKVDFDPTVNRDGTIHLKLSPEVSTLDYSNAVTISGFTIPALSTRRADTEVEIQDGQSFIVSGLLDHRTTEMMSKVPGIANVPILGQLFRSKSFNHSVVELVIIVTATVVDPLKVPLRPAPEEPRFVVPNLDTSTFDMSSQEKEKSRSALPPSQPAALPGSQPREERP